MKKIINNRLIFYIFATLLFGLIVARKLYSGNVLFIVITFLFLAMLIIWLSYYKKFKTLVALILIFFAGTGMSYLGQALYNVKSYSNSVAVVGRVSDDITEESGYYRVLVEDVFVNGEGAKNISLFISRDNSSQIKAGDRIAFESDLTKVSLWTLESFNSHYYRNNIGYTSSCKISNIIVTDGWTTVDEKVRLSVKEALQNNMSQENASICYGLLFGDKNGIDGSVKIAFQKAGVVHILAVSGLHVSFIVGLVYGLLKLCKVNRYVRFILTSLFIVFFAYLCNFSPSVLRAGIMATVFLLSQLLGRRYDTLTSLGLAGTIIIIFSPLSAYDVGFLLSIYCVLGIHLLGGLIFKLLVKFMPKQVAMTLAMSLAAQIVTIPILAYMGSSFNFLAPFANLLIIPFLGILYPYLFVTAFLSAIIPALGFLLVPASWGVSGVVKVVEFFAGTLLQTPLSSFNIVVSLLLLLLLFVVSKCLMIDKFKKMLVSLSLVLVIALTWGLASIPNKTSSQASIAYLCAYQQEAVLFTNSSGQRLLVGDNTLVEKYAKNKNIDNIDYYLSMENLNARLIRKIEEYNVESYLCFKGDTSFDEVSLLETDVNYIINGYIVKFHSYNGLVMGVSIYFESARIFIACQGREGYNSYYQQLFADSPPALLFAGRNYQIAEGYVSVSSVKNDVSTLNFDDEGNMIFIFKDFQISKGGLD